MKFSSLFFAFCLSAFATDAIPPPLSNADWNENTDYAEIRRLFAAGPEYNAYVVQALEKALIAAAMKEWETGSKAEALLKLEKIIETLPVSIETYRRLADGYAVFVQAVKDPEKKKLLTPIEHHYRIVAEGLLKSIVASGDGKTPKSAYKVISIPEEYMALWYLDLVPNGHVQEEYDGRHFDVLKVRHRKSGEESTVYFDIQAFYLKSGPPPQPIH